MDTVRVTGTRYPAGHYLCPTHSSQAGGPLMQIPGEGPQTFVGWKRVKIDKADPINELGDVVLKNDFENDKGKIRHSMKPILYRWELDPAPVLVRKTREIAEAISLGLIVVVEDAPKKRAGGEK